MKNITANIYKRILAVIIDHLIINIVLLVAYLKFFADSIDQVTIDYNTYLIFSGLTFFYFFIFESIFHKTIGKRIFNLKIVSAGGRPLDWTQTLIRNLLRPIDLTGFYLLGFIFIVLTSKSQRLGDLLAKTIVVENI